MCLTLGFNTLRGLGSWGEAAVVWASCQNIPPSIWAIIRGKVGHQMGGNYQVERRGFARRGRRVQRQFVAVDNDRVARGAPRAQLTVRRPRRPLQRTLTLVWREEIIGWTKGGGGSRAVIIMITIASSSCRSKDMTEFLSCRWSVLNSYKPPVKNVCLFHVSLWLRGEKSAVRPVGGWRTVFMSEPLFVCLFVCRSVRLSAWLHKKLLNSLWTEAQSR